MIKVTVDLFPYGNVEKKREISSFYIANDGTGNSEVGNYLFKKKEEDPWEKSVQGHFRAYGIEYLIKQVLEQHYCG